jgi:hypothetical protein
MTRLSCHPFPLEPGAALVGAAPVAATNCPDSRPAGSLEKYSLTSLQQRLVKTGGRLVKHARYYWLLLGEGHRTGGGSERCWARIALLPLPIG